MRCPAPLSAQLGLSRGQHKHSNVDGITLPSLTTTSSASSHTSAPCRSQVKKMRAMPHLPKAVVWKMPLPGNQKARLVQFATAPNLAQVQPAIADARMPHQMPPMACGTLSFIDEDSEERSSVIERHDEELTDGLDGFLDDDDDELDLFDCKATRKWRARAKEKEKQRRCTVLAQQNQNLSRGNQSLMRFPSISSDLPGYVGALTRSSRVSQHSFSHCSVFDSKDIMDQMGNKLSKINKVMDMLFEEDSKNEGCEIDQPLKKSIPLLSRKPKPRQTLIMSKIKTNLNKAQKQMRDVPE